MTGAQRLQAAGWVRVPAAGNECGEALTTRAKLIGLACGKGAVWTRDGLRFAVCQQHALLRAADETSP